MGITVAFLEILSTTGCVTPYGEPDNTGTGALAGGMLGALAGGLAGGRHAGGAAVVGGLTGAVVGGLIGHSIDEDQRYHLHAQYPQTYYTIQHNDALYYQQPPTVYYQQPATVQPQPQPQPQPPTVQAQPPKLGQAQPSAAPIALTVDDIKALASAGVRKEAIIAEIERSRSVFTQADIAALLQSNPNIDPAIVQCMQKTIRG